MKNAYPIIITKGQEYYIVHVPDFEIDTQGTNIADAIAMARDAIGMTGCFMEDEHRELPAPSNLLTIEHDANDIVTLVDIDFTEYRRKNDQKTVRKNVTIPSWLNVEAEKHKINVSRVLTEALIERVGKKI